MRVGVSRHHIENDCVKKLQNIDSGPRNDAAEKLKAILEGRPALAGILSLRRNPERLAEILLMDPTHMSIIVNCPVIAFDKEESSIPHDPRLNRRDIKADKGSAFTSSSHASE